MDQKSGRRAHIWSEYEVLTAEVGAMLPDIEVLALSRKDLGPLIALTAWNPRTLQCLVVSSSLARRIALGDPTGRASASKLSQLFYGLARVGLPTELDPIRRLTSSAIRGALSTALEKNIIPPDDAGEEHVVGLPLISRMYTITPQLDQIEALLDGGLSSAKDIVGVGEDRFMSHFAKPLGGEMEAKDIYRSASQSDDARTDDCD